MTANDNYIWKVPQRGFTPQSVSNPAEALYYLFPRPRPGSTPKVLKEVLADGGKDFEAMDAPFAWHARTVKIVQVVSGVAQLSDPNYPPTVVDEIEGYARNEHIRLRFPASEISNWRVWADHGFLVNEKQLKSWMPLMTASIEASLSPTVYGTYQKGWVTLPPSTQPHYILGDSVITPSGGSEVIALDHSAAGHGASSGIEKAGDLEVWIMIFTLFLHNPGLAVLIGFACSAPLIRRLTGMEPGIVNLVGGSGLGKTTALQAIASLFGNPSRPSSSASCIGTWRTTENGAEGPLAARSDCVVLLDEVHQAPETLDWQSFLYMMANGQGKARMNKEGGRRVPLSWTVQLISSGEVSLESKVNSQRNGSKIMPGGLQFRVIDLDIASAQLWEDVAEQAKLPKGGRYAAFLRRYGSASEPSAARIIEALERGLMENHGHMWPQLIRWLQNNSNIETAQRTYDKFRAFMEEQTEPEASMITKRRIKHVAAALTGLEILLNLMEIESNSPIMSSAMAWAVESFWKAGLDLHGGDEASQMVEAFIERLLAEPHRIEGYGLRDSHKDSWGWKNNDGSVFIPTTTGLRGICKELGLDPKRLQKALLAHGWSASQQRKPSAGRAASPQRGVISPADLFESVKELPVGFPD